MRPWKGTHGVPASVGPAGARGCVEALQQPRHRVPALPGVSLLGVPGSRHGWEQALGAGCSLLVLRTPPWVGWVGLGWVGAAAADSYGAVAQTCLTGAGPCRATSCAPALPEQLLLLTPASKGGGTGAGMSRMSPNTVSVWTWSWLRNVDGNRVHLWKGPGPVPGRLLGVPGRAGPSCTASKPCPERQHGTTGVYRGLEGSGGITTSHGGGQREEQSCVFAAEGGKFQRARGVSESDCAARRWGVCEADKGKGPLSQNKEGS